MANVLQHPVDFTLRPLSHAPSPLGFGFGLASSPSAGWQLPTTPVGHTNPAAFHQLASSMNVFTSARAQKRRHEGDEGDGDRSMDRSPTPDRPKRAIPKRARVELLSDPSKPNTNVGAKAPVAAEDDSDVDVGMLLASLPSQSLLPLLSSLLNSQPSLKPVILSLIPRPSLEVALQALTQSAKKLRDAYPFSYVPSFTSPQSVLSTTSRFGKSLAPQSHSTFGNNHAMRDSYIIDRLRPHIAEFVSTCFSYLPYFSSSPVLWRAPPLAKEKPHPAETYLFLSGITNHVLSQAPVIHPSLSHLLLPRLLDEWKAWVDRVDETVNQQGGMFGQETVQSWERGLDQMAASKLGLLEGGNPMERIRNLWVAKVGWMVGRRVEYGEMSEIL